MTGLWEGVLTALAFLLLSTNAAMIVLVVASRDRTRISVLGCSLLVVASALMIYATIRVTR